MKTKIILSLITVIFLSSCAGKFSLTKRKYTKGYYFATSKNTTNSKKEAETNHVTVKHLNTKKIALDQPVTNDTELKNIPPVEFAKTEMPVLNSKKVKQVNTIAKNLTASNQTKILYQSPAIKSLPATKNPMQQAKTNDSDVKLIVMVILCFFPFINLIPVYIHDGKDLTLNFLITLLLDFTIIFGIIFALLVVLDVIDLK